MRPGSRHRVDLRLAILERLAAGNLDEARQYLLVNLVETYLELDAAEQATYQGRLQVEGRTAVETLELTWGERMQQKGALQAKREDLLYVIRTRFNAVPESLAARIAQADDAQLTQLLGQAVTVGRLEELNY